MTPSSDGVLVMDAGDLPSLAAVALEPEASRLVLWPVPALGVSAAATNAVHRVVRAKGEAFGVRGVIGSASRPMTAAGAAEPIIHGRLLLDALAVAGERCCSRIVWPIQVGPEADRVIELVQRVHLITALAQTGQGLDGPPIDLPVMDLSDSEVVDLAEDTGAPMQLFWPCERTDEVAAASADEPCGQCPGCRRWLGAFDHAGLAWPWVVADSTATIGGGA